MGEEEVVLTPDESAGAPPAADSEGAAPEAGQEAAPTEAELSEDPTMDEVQTFLRGQLTKPLTEGRVEQILRWRTNQQAVKEAQAKLEQASGAAKRAADAEKYLRELVKQDHQIDLPEDPAEWEALFHGDPNAATSAPDDIQGQLADLARQVKALADARSAAQKERETAEAVKWHDQQVDAAVSGLPKLTDAQKAVLRRVVDLQARSTSETVQLKDIPYAKIAKQAYADSVSAFGNGQPAAADNSSQPAPVPAATLTDEEAAEEAEMSPKERARAQAIKNAMAGG